MIAAYVNGIQVIPVVAAAVAPGAVDAVVAAAVSPTAVDAVVAGVVTGSVLLKCSAPVKSIKHSTQV